MKQDYIGTIDTFLNDEPYCQETFQGQCSEHRFDASWNGTLHQGDLSPSVSWFSKATWNTRPLSIESYECQSTTRDGQQLQFEGQGHYCLQNEKHQESRFKFEDPLLLFEPGAMTPWMVQFLMWKKQPPAGSFFSIFSVGDKLVSRCRYERLQENSHDFKIQLINRHFIFFRSEPLGFSFHTTTSGFHGRVKLESIC